ncbi:TcdA/TcdB pore-forming domain-containing protein [Burkholderia territorii]|uniref:TcdA/TcdB pore-forming domain-containing protein n=1 Tax=Burkholderia territorii TaxID=1503055 RepID=UPI0009C08523|nr:TcdA/TcdB pore-forming domain-containing protein [Burkholderia territorii]
MTNITRATRAIDANYSYYKDGDSNIQGARANESGISSRAELDHDLSQKEGWAKKLTIKITQEWFNLTKKHSLPSGSMPNLLSFKKLPNEVYEMQVRTPDGTSQTVHVNSDSALIEAHNETKQTISQFNKHFEVKESSSGDWQLHYRPNVSVYDARKTLTRLHGITTLNLGFYILEEFNSNPHQTLLPPEARLAMQLQYQVQFAQTVVGLTDDALQLHDIFLDAIDSLKKGESKLKNLLPPTVKRAGEKIPVRKILSAASMALAIASFSANTISAVNAKTEEERDSAATSAAFDGLSVFMELPGFLTTFDVNFELLGISLEAIAEFAGPLAIPVGALSFGFAAIAGQEGKNIDQTKMIGQNLNEIINGYRKQAYSIEKSNNQNTLKPTQGVIITHLDLRNQQVEFGDTKAYKSDWKDSRGLPDEVPALHQDQSPLSFRDVFKLPKAVSLPFDKNGVASIHLPSTPEHTYSYGWAPELTVRARHDTELESFRELEKTGEFQFEFGDKAINEMTPNYTGTTIKVTLPKNSPPMIIDEIGAPAKFITYDIDGVNGGNYILYLNDGVTVRLSNNEASRGRSVWTLQTSFMETEEIRYDDQAKALKIGGATLLTDKIGKHKIKIVTRSGDEYEWLGGDNSLRLASINAERYRDENELGEALRRLESQGKLTLNVKIKNATIKWNAIQEHQGGAGGKSLEEADYQRSEKYYSNVDYYYSSTSKSYVFRANASMTTPAPINKIDKTIDFLNIGDIRISASEEASRVEFLDAEAQKEWQNGGASPEYRKKLFAYNYAAAAHDFNLGRRNDEYALTRKGMRLIDQLLPSEERVRTQRGQRKVQVSRLGYSTGLTNESYASEDALVITREDDRQGAHVVLYLPKENPSLYEFRSRYDLLAWISKISKTDDGLKMIVSHFSNENQNDGHFLSGARSVFRGIAIKGWSKTHIELDKFKIKASASAFE